MGLFDNPSAPDEINFEEMLELMTRMNRFNASNPYGSQSWTEGADGQWTVNQTANPQTQALIDQQYQMLANPRRMESDPNRGALYDSLMADRMGRMGVQHSPQPSQPAPQPAPQMPQVTQPVVTPVPAASDGPPVQSPGNPAAGPGGTPFRGPQGGGLTSNGGNVNDIMRDLYSSGGDGGGGGGGLMEALNGLLNNANSNPNAYQWAGRGLSLAGGGLLGSLVGNMPRIANAWYGRQGQNANPLAPQYTNDPNDGTSQAGQPYLLDNIGEDAGGRMPSGLAGAYNSAPPIGLADLAFGVPGARVTRGMRGA